MWIMLEDTDKLFWEHAYLWLTQKTNNRNMLLYIGLLLYMLLYIGL